MCAYAYKLFSNISNYTKRQNHLPIKYKYREKEENNICMITK